MNKLSIQDIMKIEDYLYEYMTLHLLNEETLWKLVKRFDIDLKFVLRTQGKLSLNFLHKLNVHKKIEWNDIIKHQPYIMEDVDHYINEYSKTIKPRKSSFSSLFSK